MALETGNVSMFLQLSITTLNVTLFCYIEVGCMQNCYGLPSEHQSIYTLQNSYSLGAEEYLKSLAPKGFKPENPERRIQKNEDYKVENIQLLMTQTQHCNPPYCP